MRRWRIFTLILTVVTFIIPLNQANAASDEFIYTKSYGGEIFKRPLDGSGSWTQVGTIGVGDGLLAYGNYIYLCWPGIKRMTLAGTGLVTLNSNSDTYNCATDGNYIYYGFESTKAIGRMNMDGSGVNDSWVTFTNTGLNSGWISVSNGFVYFGGGVNASSKLLGKVSTSGGTVSVIHTDPCAISGIATDATNIYLSHFYCNTVSKLDLDGSLVTSTFMTGLTYSQTWAAQVWNGYLYVLDTTYVARIKLDGTGFQLNYLTGAGGRGMTIFGTLSVQTSLSTFTLPSNVQKGISANISVTFSAVGKVTYFANGKKIANCVKISTSNNAPFTATCAWKPAVRGNQKVTVSIAPSESNNLPFSANLGSAVVVSRSTKR